MLRWPIKIAIICGALLGVILGAHGLYVYFSPAEVIFGAKDIRDLFLAWDAPSQLDGMIEWAGIKGFQSWFIPACLIVAGIFLWYWQTKIYARRLRLSRLLMKAKRRIW